MSSQDIKSTIVIVGGGVGGLGILNSLSTTINPKKHAVILIDARPAYVHLISSLRLVVSSADNLITRSVHPFGDHTFLKKLKGVGTFIQASVSEIRFSDNGRGGTVILDNGKTVAYAVLVLATGSTLPHPIAFPTKSTEVIEEYVKARQEEFASATDILLVGGGPVGIELAGELRDVFPSKSITILHRSSLLLNPAYPDRFRVAIQQQLEDRHITVLTGDSITLSATSMDQVPKDGFVTDNGRTLKPDLVIPTWGMRPNTAYLPSDLLSPTGHVKVLPTFQLVAHPDVFAIGDIIDWDERKSASKVVHAHAPKTARNVLLYLRLLEAQEKAQEKGSGEAKSNEDTDLMASRESAKYKGSTEMIMISDGKFSGMGYLDILWGIIINGWISSFSSRDLAVSRLPRFTGYTPVC
ncbi:hypothetical protein C8R42DRAFT_264943 [Lentinula raphanica]|nr:hypothetical protein C8R42DRAFT_264943 [Lentinula raphanica]